MYVLGMSVKVRIGPLQPKAAGSFVGACQTGSDHRRTRLCVGTEECNSAFPRDRAVQTEFSLKSLLPVTNLQANYLNDSSHGEWEK